jgi:exodeoxyribonuclease-3
MLDEVSLVDSFRFLWPDKIAYSWWSYMREARNKNEGWRIDYILVSKGSINNIKSSEILKEMLGSDHCPV